MRGRSRTATSRKLRYEQLENKRLLAITWANELDINGDFDPNNGFVDEYQENAQVARSIVNRAIDDWEAVINSFNYDVDSDGNRSNDLDGKKREEKGTFYLFQ